MRALKSQKYSKNAYAQEAETLPICLSNGKHLYECFSVLGLIILCQEHFKDLGGIVFFVHSLILLVIEASRRRIGLKKFPCNECYFFRRVILQTKTNNNITCIRLATNSYIVVLLVNILSHCIIDISIVLVATLNIEPSFLVG